MDNSPWHWMQQLQLLPPYFSVGAEIRAEPSLPEDKPSPPNAPTAGIHRVVSFHLAKPTAAVGTKWI